MKILKTMSRVAGLLLLAVSSQVRAVAIDALTVENVSLQLSVTEPALVAGNYSASGAVVPPAVITMGNYQADIFSTMLSSGLFSADVTVYTAAGPGGNPPPSGSIDGSNMTVDLSSLRANVVFSSLGSTLGTADFELWPLTLPNTTGAYNPTSGLYDLGWNVDFSTTVMTDSESLPISGNVDITLGVSASLVPIPPAVWLFASGLLGLAGIARRKATV